LKKDKVVLTKVVPGKWLKFSEGIQILHRMAPFSVHLVLQAYLCHEDTVAIAMAAHSSQQLSYFSSWTWEDRSHPRQWLLHCFCFLPLHLFSVSLWLDSLCHCGDPTDMR